MQINLLTYPRIYYTLGRWLGMVVYIILEIFRAGPPYKLAGLQPNCNFNFFWGFWGELRQRVTISFTAPASANSLPLFLTDRNF